MAGRSEVTGLLVSLVLSIPAAAFAAGASPVEDVPVRGGVAALADAIPISPAPDRARFMAEAVRVVYSWPQTGPYTNEPMRRRIAGFFAASRSGDPVDEIPVPLPAAVWSKAVFHRTVSRDDLAGAILGDRTAALICYSLAGLDDETLQFFSTHESLLSRLSERAPAAFAAFGESLHIKDGRLAVPGGDGAAPAWEAIVGEKLDRPDRFVQTLFENDRGRVAYLFDILAHLDPATLSLTIGSPSVNAESLKRLASLVRRAFPEWDVTTAPFVRAPADLSAFFGRLRATAGVESGGAALRTVTFWHKVFDETASTGDMQADVVWLAEAILAHPPRERERRLDLFGSVERVFGSAPAGDDTVAAAHGFGSYSVLMLTLERMGVRTPAVYAAAAQQAEKLSALDSTRGSIALSQFQGALALVARLASVRSIDTATAESLSRDLFALRLDDSGHYATAVASWMSEHVVPRLPPASSTQTVDDVILGGAAGPTASERAPRLEWEGQRYRIDPATAELGRLRRARDHQEGVSFATALEAASMARTLGALAPRADVIRADTLLGEALLSFAYACDLGDPEGTILIAGDPARRHDFGYDLPGRDARMKAMWGIAAIETRKGPWHLVGSALALDVAMAPLALRRISVDRVPESPMLNLMQRDQFAATVAIMNTSTLTDADRDRIADGITAGQRRIAALAAGGETPETISRAVDLDGWRAQALTWTMAHDREHVPALFSLTETLVLGGGSPSAFGVWGTYAFRTAGCLCSRLAAPGEWRRWWGLSQAGLPAILVADLPLNVAVLLHNLQLPAVLAKPVLAAAMQDFVDATNPTDGNDWLTLSRAAQVVDRTRFEDYVASAAADGPLVAESESGR